MKNLMMILLVLIILLPTALYSQIGCDWPANCAGLPYTPIPPAPALTITITTGGCIITAPYRFRVCPDLSIQFLIESPITVSAGCTLTAKQILEAIGDNLMSLPVALPSYPPMNDYDECKDNYSVQKAACYNWSGTIGPTGTGTILTSCGYNSCCNSLYKICWDHITSTYSKVLLYSFTGVPCPPTLPPGCFVVCE